jgi:hypothetical protein
LDALGSVSIVLEPLQTAGWANMLEKEVGKNWTILVRTGDKFLLRKNFVFSIQRNGS